LPRLALRGSPARSLARRGVARLGGRACL